MEIDTSGMHTPYWGYSTRRAFYNVSSTPATWFDGSINCVGSYATSQQQYTWYKNEFQARLAVPTDVAIEMAAVLTGTQTLDVTATVHLEAAGSPKTMRIYMVQLLDNYPSSPYYARNFLRQVIEEGYDIALEPGESETITRSVTLDSTTWSRLLDAKLVAWAQIPTAAGPAEIFNAAQLPIYSSIPLPGDFDLDGFVGPADLALWQDGFGTLTGATFGIGDADRDGDVDGNDFLAWQQHRGDIINRTPAGSAPVPEPATALIALGILAIFGARIFYPSGQRTSIV